MAYNNETLDEFFKRDLTALEKHRRERREFCEGLTYGKIMQAVFASYQKRDLEIRSTPTHIALSEEIRYSVEKAFAFAAIELSHEKDGRHSDKIMGMQVIWATNLDYDKMICL